MTIKRSWLSVLVLCVGVAVIGYGAWHYGTPQEEIEHVILHDRDRGSSDAEDAIANADYVRTELVFREGDSVSIPSYGLSFTLPSGWSMSDETSVAGPSTYNQTNKTTQVPYVHFNLRNSSGSVVAKVSCPAPAVGFEDIGEKYQIGTSSKRAFNAKGTSFNASYDYYFEVGPNRIADMSAPLWFMSHITSNKDLVEGAERQSCNVWNETAFSVSDIDGLVSIYNSWH